MPYVDPSAPKSKPKAFYDYGEGSLVEDQVATLVELFAKTKRRQVSASGQAGHAYSAVVAVTVGGEERLVLCRRDALNSGAQYWPPDWRLVAPHELTGRLPKPYAPTCAGATSSGRPCRTGVRLYGDHCSRHAALGAEQTNA